MENKQIYKGPSSMFLLFLVFLTLKLTGFIGWSWWWITAPLWMGVVFLLSLGLVFIFGAAVVIIIGALIDKFKK